MSQTLNRRNLLLLGGLAATIPLGMAEAQPAHGNDSARRAELYGLLGDLPDRRRPIGSRKRGEQERDGYVLETWELDLNGMETVPAYLARPRRLSGRRRRSSSTTPTAATTRSARQEFVRRAQVPPEPAVREGAHRLGYIALASTTGLRRRSQTESADLQAHAVVGAGDVGDDAVRQRPRAGLPRDPRRRRHGRLGTLGISMGSNMAWWLAAVDERVKVTSTSAA